MDSPLRSNHERFTAMESTGEGGGGAGGGGGELGLGLGLGFSEIDTVAEGLGRSEVFHIVKEVIGFVLYIHHQIPSVLQNLENEFLALKEEFKNLVDSGTPAAESKPSDQRKHNMRKREVKQGIKRQEKLMNGISSLLSALQDAFDEVPSIQGVTLVLGGSVARPLHVYDMLFSNGRFSSGSAKECTKSKVAQTLSRKAIRALISSGAGSTFTGPSKLFLLVKCPSTFNLPLHFLPKREFRYAKKVVPFRLHIKCKAKDGAMIDQHYNPISSSYCMSDSTQNEDIWHTVKGLACKAPVEC